MKNFVKIFKALKALSISELVVILTLFATTIGWVYKVNAQMGRGIERDIKTDCVEKEIQNIKISVAELKTSTDKIDKNVEILLTRGLYERDNR